MKKIVSMMSIALLAICIAACGKKDVTETADAEMTTEKIIEEVPAEEHSADNINQLNFSTTDIDGAAFSFDDLKDSSLIMVNFWEPWCGPCVGEMPELEKLYQNYKDRGLIILGVFYSTDYLDDAEDVLDYAQITYPVVIGNNDFIPYVTEYVPTTVFFDSEGNLLNSEPVIGSRSYDDWEQEILKYLND